MVGARAFLPAHVPIIWLTSSVMSEPQLCPARLLGALSKTICTPQRITRCRGQFKNQQECSWAQFTKKGRWHQVLCKVRICDDWGRREMNKSMLVRMV
jgi:hypothetical protein